MTESTLAVIIAAVAPTLTGIGTLIATLRNGRVVIASKENTDHIVQQTEAVTKKTDEIHILVNSNLAAVKADLALANQRVQKLETMLATLIGGKESITKDIAENAPKPPLK
jgi:hypothetical protein